MTKLKSGPGKLKALLHLAGGVGFALVQPGYDLLGRYPEFFVARKVALPEVAVTVGLLSVGLPLLLWLIAMVLRSVSKHLYRGYMAVVLGALAGAVVVQLLKSQDALSLPLNLWIAGLSALVFAILYWRVAAVSAFLTLLSPVAVLFPALFLFYSPVSKVLFADAVDVLGPPIKSKTPVIFIVFDELPTTSLMARDRTIDAQSFPAFAALAANSTWYRNATTVAAGSLNAIPAILTGRYPVHTYIPNAVDYPENVFSLLGRSYGISAHEPITALCTEYLCSRPPPVGLRAAVQSLGSDLWVIYQHLLLPNALTESLPAVDENWMGFAPAPVEFAPVTVDKVQKTGPQIVRAIKEQSAQRVIKAGRMDYGSQFESALASINPQRQRFLYFQHVQLPHVPWRYLPSGKQYKETFVNGKEGRDKWINEQPWLMAQGFQRHLLQVKFVDALLGKLLARLRDTGIYDDAMIIVTADHGASFRMGAKRRSTTPENLPEIAGVPLLVKLPGQTAPEISDAFVETVDIVPTIADVLDVALPWTMDGFSLLDNNAPRDRVINVRSIYGQSVYLEQEDLQAREWILAFKAQWFGESNEIGDLFAMGPGKHYLGRAEQSLDAIPAQAVSATLVRPMQYQKVYLHSPYSPARVSGRLHFSGAEIRDNDTVLVGINGTVRGSGQVFTKDGEGGYFSVMVPSGPFNAGANAVELFLLDERNSGTTSIRKVPVVDAADVSVSES